MKILVTGVTGFVGANVARALIKSGHRVGAICRRENWRIEDICDKLEILNADITNKRELENVIRKSSPDFIYHLAAYGCYPRRQTDFWEMVCTNIMGTANLAEASGGIPIINTGSSSEYGMKWAPMKEDDLCAPNNDYGLTKLCQTLYCQKMGIPTLRLFSVYGPWEDSGRLISAIMLAKISGSGLKLRENVRDYVYAGDIAGAFLCTSEKYSEARGKVFNVGSGKQRGVKDILLIIDNIDNKKLKIEWDFNSSQKEPSSWVADMDRTTSELGWTPSITLEDGLRRTYEWWKQNGELARKE